MTTKYFEKSAEFMKFGPKIAKNRCAPLFSPTTLREGFKKKEFFPIVGKIPSLKFGIEYIFLFDIWVLNGVLM